MSRRKVKKGLLEIASAYLRTKWFTDHVSMFKGAILAIIVLASFNLQVFIGPISLKDNDPVPIIDCLLSRQHLRRINK